MPFDPTPWMIRGARHSAALGRAELYASTNGAEGVVEPGDLKITALGVPGAAVQYAAGGVLVRSRYANQTQQTYGARNPVIDQRAISPNLSGAARYDLVIVRVKDPEFETIPDLTDPKNYQYVYVDVIQGVAANTASVGQVAGVTYPAYALARVHMPAGATTVTAGQITDLRRVANPRTYRQMFSIYGTGNKTGGHRTPTAGYASWPITSAQRPQIFVPEWATHMDVVGHYSGVYYERGGSTEDTVAGIRTGFGTGGAENGIIIADVTDTFGRFHYTVVGDHAVDASQRGTTQLVNLQALRTRGTGSWYADYQTSINVDIQFTEQAV
jgi:hypothetical protein